MKCEIINGLSKGIINVCSVKKYIGVLEREIKLEYDYTMNRMSFNKVVMSHPEEFAHITLPQKNPEFVPQKGNIVSLIYICLSPWGQNQRNVYRAFTLTIYTLLCFICSQGVFLFLTLPIRRTKLLLSTIPC